MSPTSTSHVQVIDLSGLAIHWPAKYQKVWIEAEDEKNSLRIMMANGFDRKEFFCAIDMAGEKGVFLFKKIYSHLGSGVYELNRAATKQDEDTINDTMLLHLERVPEGGVA